MAPIELSVQKNIATITLNRPEKLNALTADLYYELGAAMRKVAAMPEVSVTILTGTGRYFSAGADVQTTGGEIPDGDGSEEATRRFWYKRFAANNIDVTRTFFTHPKILIVALNGPAVGLSAALVGFADFIYAAPHAFIMTPFTSLGLVAEGGASYSFIRRMGIAKANEALILSRQIPCDELVQCGFVNKVFEKEQFQEKVKAYVEDTFGQHLNHDSMMKVKKLIREGWEREAEAANVREAVGGVERFTQGIPQQEFIKLATGQKKHKL
ncbi:ClpP/crotonase-like domain-containing protein [Pyronema domesticum]|uniref:Similar to 3,2-trans-enoyl-CoA isomerase acc. no. Q05871 n=1 Tax=Pyronema omphalodes (strain CBS 100304) TaxID=1076935 RepID=U4L5F7_PYROM|nr:ClpP/crotonase-like domain-containing protein [Pyronema domesticum]CCX11378.1 Similar to 3,2-trans-enoyl-CoA isomerase; acc. no. Q05871 [Pyronema omphalodes CBS 100304]